MYSYGLQFLFYIFISKKYLCRNYINNFTNEQIIYKLNKIPYNSIFI